MSLLEVRDLEVGYGLLPVIHGLSFSVEEGSTTVLLGLNGAGKTTTINTIAGLLAPWKGEVFFNGEPIGGLPADRVVERGIALSPEGRRVFPGLERADEPRAGCMDQSFGDARRRSNVSTATSRSWSSVPTSWQGRFREASSRCSR